MGEQKNPVLIEYNLLERSMQKVADEIQVVAEETLSDKLDEIFGDTSEVIPTPGGGTTTALKQEIERATAAENALNKKIDAEITRATEAEKSLADDIKSETDRANEADAALDKKISDEVDRATSAEKSLGDRIDNLETSVDTTITEKLTEVFDKVNQVEESVNTTVTQKIETVNTKIVQLQDDVNTTINQSITEINTKVDQVINTAITNIEGDINTITESISEIEGNYVPNSQKAVAGGVATLDADGKLVQMPTPEDIGAMPANTAFVSPTRTINSKPLTANVVLTASDVSALPDTTNYVPTSRKVAGKALTADITLTPADIGAAAANHGTHVTFGTDDPKVAGTAAVGTATTVSRSDHVHPAQTSVSGNAGTATKLATARKIGSASFDGSADITLTQIGAAATSHVHSVATTTADGFMSNADKTKLDGIATGANNYVHPTTSGNKHIPSGGSSGQILRWSADGTAVWGADNNTTYSAFKAATASAAGGAGLVPAPAAGKQLSFLRGDGTWVVPTNTTYGVTSKTAAGLAPQLPNETTTTKYLRQDGTWQVPPNTVYTHPTTSGNKHIPSGGSSGQILRWSADGTAVWGADNNTTYSAATQSANGLMSAADKKKLDGIAASAVAKAFHVGTTAPTNTNLLWIDTTANASGIKYHNGTAWVAVPVFWG